MKQDGPTPGNNYHVAFDVELKRPGCVLLQATLGGDIPSFEDHFPSETWLVHPTPNMKLYTVSREELGMLSAMVKKGMKTARKGPPRFAEVAPGVFEERAPP